MDEKHSNERKKDEMLTESKHIFAKYGIQVIEPQSQLTDPELIPPVVWFDTLLHLHPGPQAIDRPEKYSEESTMAQVCSLCCFPCRVLQNHLVDLCERFFTNLGRTLTLMEETYTFACCNLCGELDATQDSHHTNTN